MQGASSWASCSVPPIEHGQIPLHHRLMPTLDWIGKKAIEAKKALTELRNFVMDQRRLLIILLIASATFLELWHFSVIAKYLLSIPPNSDAELFLAMGRGILNGLHIYRDLFESKPPILFLLAALVNYFGNYSLFVWIQVLLLFLLAPTLVFFSWRKTGNLYKTSICFLLGITIATQSLMWSWGFEGEGFALLFAILPTLLWKRSLCLAGVSLGIAAMIKEPFVVSAGMAMLVFCEGREDFRRLLYTVLIGIGSSLCILLLSGVFIDYFTLYLPEMFTGRVNSYIMYPDYGKRLYFLISAPLWVKTLEVYKIFLFLADPVTSLLLPVFFIGCLVIFPCIRAKDFRIRSMVFSAAFMLAAVFAGAKLFFAYEFLSVITLLGKQIPWSNPIVLYVLSLVLLPIMLLSVFSGFVYWKWRTSRQVVFLTIAATVGLFLTGALMTYGGFYDGMRYTIFAFPFLIAVALYCITHGRKFMLFITALLIFNVFMPGRFTKTFAFNSEAIKAIERTNQFALAGPKLDSIMDSCKYDRYFLANTHIQPLMAFTSHSPYQISYGQQRAVGSLGFSAPAPPNKFFAEKFQTDMHDTQIIVAALTDDPFQKQDKVHNERIKRMDPIPDSPTSRIPVDLVPTMQKDFTLIPPPCAEGIAPIKGIKIFFRKGFQ